MKAVAVAVGVDVSVWVGGAVAEGAFVGVAVGMLSPGVVLGVAATPPTIGSEVLLAEGVIVPVGVGVTVPPGVPVEVDVFLVPPPPPEGALELPPSAVPGSSAWTVAIGPSERVRAIGLAGTSRRIASMTAARPRPAPTLMKLRAPPKNPPNPPPKEGTLPPAPAPPAASEPAGPGHCRSRPSSNRALAPTGAPIATNAPNAASGANFRLRSSHCRHCAMCRSMTLRTSGDIVRSSAGSSATSSSRQYCRPLLNMTKAPIESSTAFFRRFSIT